MMLLELATATMNPQQLMALMSGNGLDPRALEELRGEAKNRTIGGRGCANLI